MATLVLSAVGAAAGASLGGGVLGLSSVVIGRAIGATIGQSIDQKLFGQRLAGSGSDVVEAGRIDRFRLAGASEGARVPEIYGRMRVSGQVIWASRFREQVQTSQVSSGGGKGGPSPQTTTVKDYSYFVSLAVAIGEGEISRIGRIWADGNEISPKDLTLRFYPGDASQLPDPKIEAVEGAGMAPAFRGTAYVVLEDLPLERFGNRVPQFNFEVVRGDQLGGNPDHDLAGQIQAVALTPGTGEYALATSPVHVSTGPGRNRSVNENTPLGVTDFKASAETLRQELPNHSATSLVVSWFGNDLRCGSCQIAPKVEQIKSDGVNMPWSVSGDPRGATGTVPFDGDGRPIYGGTPTDASVVEAIAELRKGGRGVLFYPFVLMEQMPGNSLPDPWTGAPDQPELPWRGRITLSVAPGRPGSPDQTSDADVEVAAFFGVAQVSDFSVAGKAVTYTGPNDTGYRRFILHYAHLCAAAGGVDAFCIGTEMRSLTQIRGANGFPAVDALRQLASDVRQILGAGTKISYAADWSEYFGYHPQDGSDSVYFHLDPLWADPEIDFIAIDNYMPLADWRDGESHADIAWGAIHNLDYLRGNIEGGEGFDWYYANGNDADNQARTPITDGAYGEDWVFRYKDLRNWWSQPHHDRPGGIRAAAPTAWVPQSKPIWFTELGCAAIDKGANAPNLFFDPKSSESALPPYSDGRRDDAMQMQFLIAHFGHWAEPANNPVSNLYGGPMVDMGRCFIWAWDARPFPFFPNNGALWSDGGNYGRGHWLNGRTSSRSLASVVTEICQASGVTDLDVSSLFGVVRGFSTEDVATGRAALQALMLGYGFDAIEANGALGFRARTGRVDHGLGADDFAQSDELAGALERIRAPEAETIGRVRINGLEAEGAYQVRSSEAIFPDDTLETVTQSDLPILMTRSELRGIAERWLAEARVARDSVRFSLPPSRTDVVVGDVVSLEDGGRYRVDRIEQAGIQIAEGVRVDAELYTPSPDLAESESVAPDFVPAVPVLPLFLDLPLLTGAEVPGAPHIAVAADPWPGDVAVFKSVAGANFTLNTSVTAPSAIGVTETPLIAARAGLYDRGAPLRILMPSGALASVTEAELFNGANTVAIGSGQSDHWEVFQFRDATLVGPDLYEVSSRLRGQAGTDGLMPGVWPAGSYVVVLTSGLDQIVHGTSERGLLRTYRTGPAALPVTDAAYVETERAFEGVGLRPYAPVHLKSRVDAAGDSHISWIRRTRIDGDTWLGYDVPLGEEREAYLVRVLDGTSILREVEVAGTGWVYTQVQKSADGIGATYSVEIAQLSDRYGPGPFGRITLNV
jgi:hypothetical protein